MVIGMYCCCATACGASCCGCCWGGEADELLLLGDDPLRLCAPERCFWPALVRGVEGGVVVVDEDREVVEEENFLDRRSLRRLFLTSVELLPALLLPPLPWLSTGDEDRSDEGRRDTCRARI